VRKWCFVTCRSSAATIFSGSTMVGVDMSLSASYYSGLYSVNWDAQVFKRSIT
jgi:hypothetical protein